ncbi:protein MICROTUBULE BINDING PROTEIN 2C isoform X1 [Dendrobium catenatum]|uniref:protein MICROTUBULE BINDING PROTEIN 2C isoform X1 n=1 Tax=Dendrobium catenatum TaxID=906689 RepID=UPI0009F3FDB3|nr:protein MICROTUBULE BINDING PROTEIN 2C isoform X1 [Dendrobium catenatum]
MEDPQRCLAERDLPTVSTSTGNGGSGSNVDRVLFKNLVEMVPLVESLMDKRASSSFARRASIVHTRAPQLKRQASDYKSKKVAQTDSIKKTRDAEESVQNDLNELLFLRDQVAELQKKLIEKEEALKSAENLTNQVNETYASVGDLRRQVVEKDALIKSTNAQLYNAKIKLADKQAALEKIEWEAKMSKKKVEELEGDAKSNDRQITAMMTLFEAIANKDSYPYLDDVSFEPPPPLQDDIGEIDTVKMEEAREAYLSAVAAAKEDPSDESLAFAAEARHRLQSLIL